MAPHHTEQLVTAPTEYTLTAADAGAFVALIHAQRPLGPVQDNPGQEQFLAFFAAIDSIAYDHYRTITEPAVKGWTDKLFTALLGTKTCYGVDAVGLYVLYAYVQFAGACFEPNNGWPCQSCGQAGFPTDWERRDGKWGTWDDSKGLPNSSPWNWFATAVGLWKPPGSPASFFDALNKDVNTLNVALQAAGHSTNAVGLLAGWNGTCDNVPAVVQFQRSRFDPSSWTDSGNFVKALLATGLWQDQSGVLTDLLAPPVLTADTYFFLLHLLLALATSTSKDRQRVQQLLNATVTSSEYPNDTFINQLVYLVLMHLADPAGPFGWTNEQLLEELDLLGGVVTGTDPGAQAIQASLSSHRRVVQSDASYPMQDPYCPSIGFTVRKTDTLRALDATRQATKSQNGGPSLA